jgi:Spy/CpxP family protein refolding chaperone
MKTFIQAAIVAASMTAGSLVAQQPAPIQPPAGARQPGQPEGRGGERAEGPGRMERREGPAGFRMMPFSPTALLDRREVLNLTADQVTKLSGLENDFKAAREKSEADAKPHREELEKLMQQTTPDVTQLRTHAQAMMQAEQTARLAGLMASVQAKAILNPEQRGRVQGWADARRFGGSGRGRGMTPRRGGPQGRMGPGGMQLRRGANQL